MTARNGAVELKDQETHVDVAAPAQSKQQSVAKSNPRIPSARAAAAPAYLRVKIGFFKDARGSFMRVTNLMFAAFLLLAIGGLLGVLTSLQSFSYFRNPAGFVQTFFSLPNSFSPLLQSTNQTQLQAFQAPQQQPTLLNTSTTSTQLPQSPADSLGGDHTANSTQAVAAGADDDDDDDEDVTHDQTRDRALVSSNSSQAEETTIDNNSTQDQVPSDETAASVFQRNEPLDFATTSDLYHNMEDEELMAKASMMQTTTRSTTIAAAPRYVTTGTIRENLGNENLSLERPKIAFLFLTRGPLPLGALWDVYFKGHEGKYSIYVHAHPNFLDPNISSSSVFFRRNIPSQVVRWGEINVFDAERRLLANALLDPQNERFILLSETCIPITNFSWAYEYITKSQHSFVDCFDDPGRGGRGRYLRIKRREKLMPEVTLRQWRKGSQWFEMSRELALLVVSDTKYYPKFRDILCGKHGHCYIDEHYLPSVLSILAPLKLANRTLTYLYFAGRGTGAHPVQWEPEMITHKWIRSLKEGHNCSYNGRTIHTSCHLFARKFSPTTLEPLLKLAPTILWGDQLN